MSNIIRKRFLEVAAAGAACLLLTVSCGNGGDATPDAAGADCTQEPAAVTVENNHPHGGHAFTVSPEDVAAGAEVTYDIQGQTSHNHTVTLTEQHFETLQGGGSVTVTSSEAEDHSHQVTVTCS